jgi:hypothetical protein
MEIKINKDQLLKELCNFWTIDNLSEFFIFRAWRSVTSDKEKSILTQHGWKKVTRIPDVFVLKKDQEDRKKRQDLRVFVTHNLINIDLEQRLHSFLPNLFENKTSLIITRKEGDENEVSQELYTDIFALYILYLIKCENIKITDGLKLLQGYLKNTIEKTVKKFYNDTQGTHALIRDKNKNEIYDYYTSIILELFSNVNSDLPLKLRIKKYEIKIFQDNPYQNYYLNPIPYLRIISNRKKLLRKLKQIEAYNFIEESVASKAYRLFWYELDKRLYSEYGIGRFKEIRIFRDFTNKSGTKTKKGIEEGLIALGYQNQIDDLLRLVETTEKYIKYNRIPHGELELITEYQDRLNELYRLVKLNENLERLIITSTDRLKEYLKLIVDSFRHYEQYVKPRKVPEISPQIKNQDEENINIIDYQEDKSNKKPEENLIQKELEEAFIKKIGKDNESIQEVIQRILQEIKSSRKTFKRLYRVKYFEAVFSIGSEGENFVQEDLARVFQVDQGTINRDKRERSQDFTRRVFRKILPMLESKEIDQTQIIEGINQNLINAIDELIEEEAERELENVFEHFLENNKLITNDLDSRIKEQIISYVNSEIQKDVPSANLYDESNQPLPLVKEYTDKVYKELYERFTTHPS